MNLFTYEKRDILTVDDCTFYGLNGEIVDSFSDISTMMKGTEEEKDGAKPIFWSKEEQPKVVRAQTNEDYTTIKIGKFTKGVSIGFVFKGDLERCQFTTPALNKSEGAYSYIGHTVRYKDGGGDYKIKGQTSNGFIYNTIIDGKPVNILGMENRTPNHRAYDGDYNDMLCYVYSTPIVMESDQPLTHPVETEEYTREKGLYLFEDNFPNEGDYDFNDVVISYEILDYFKSADKKKDVTVQLLAKGATRINQFGFMNNGEEEILIKDITGKGNVYQTNFSTNNYSKVERRTYYGEIKPFLHNGNNYIYDDNFFNTGSYPYVLVIPSLGNADDYFNWCTESDRIDEAYNFKAPRANDWYVKPIDEDLVVKRPTTSRE